jgi:hypothetical protein
VNSVYPQIGKIEAKATLLVPEMRKIEAKRTLFIPQIQKIEVGRTLFIPEIGKIKAKKTNWMEATRTEAVFLKLLWSPGIDFKELIPPLCPGGLKPIFPTPLRLF